MANSMANSMATVGYQIERGGQNSSTAGATTTSSVSVPLALDILDGYTFYRLRSTHFFHI